MSLVSLFTWIFAIAGAACTLLAALGPVMGFMGRSYSVRWNKAGYFLMFVSIGLFILKGFLHK